MEVHWIILGALLHCVGNLDLIHNFMRHFMNGMSLMLTLTLLCKCFAIQLMLLIGFRIFAPGGRRQSNNPLLQVTMIFVP